MKETQIIHIFVNRQINCPKYPINDDKNNIENAKCISTHGTTNETIRATKLADLLELSALKFYFKYLHEPLPRFFYSFNIATQGTQHSHDTRQRDQLRIDRFRINLAGNRIRIFLPTLVNSTPLDPLHKIKTHSTQGFLSHIKIYLINIYRDNCSNTIC